MNIFSFSNQLNSDERETETAQWTPIFGGFLIMCLIVGTGCSGTRTLSEGTISISDKNTTSHIQEIQRYLNDHPRDKVNYSAWQLKNETGNGTKRIGALGAYRSGRKRIRNTPATIDQRYTESFHPEKFSRSDIQKILVIIRAIQNNHSFKKQLANVVYLLRNDGKITVSGLSEEGVHEPFETNYGQSEPGGAVIFQNDQPELLFCEPGAALGQYTYSGTDHSVRAADIGTFHGHHEHPGPSPQDITAAMITRTDSLIITDRGEMGNYTVNIDFVNEQGHGVDLSTITLPKPKRALSEK